MIKPEYKKSRFHTKTGFLQIIIMNEDFRKVREEEIDSMEEINAQSTLVPVIYRSELIASIDNVSYYMLK